MKSIRSASLFKVWILLVAGLGVPIGFAHAQAVASGTFTLTRKTHWGGAVLPPGDYAFSLASPSWPSQLVVRKAAGPHVAILMPRLITQEKVTRTSSLTLQHEADGEAFVTALYLGDLGLALHYPSPKAPMAASETARLGPVPDSQPIR
jgi:hypothetical protein